MSPPKRKPLLKSLISTNLSCGCGATRPNQLTVYEPQPKPKPKSKSSSPSSNNSPTTSLLLDTSESSLDDILSLIRSVAVVKESKDPYKDFRHSMLEIIFENQIFTTENLHNLLQCFLRLNSPSHHHFILLAFFRVCDDIISSSTHAWNYSHKIVFLRCLI